MLTKVVLVACYGAMQPVNAEPLAVETLAGALAERFGSQILTELLVLDERKDPGGIRLARQLATRSDIDVIGLSVPQSTFSCAVDFLDCIKAARVQPLIVLGHALPTHSSDTFLNRFPNVIIVRGWGEAAMCGIVEQYRTGNPNWSRVPSLLFKQGRKITTTQIEWPPTPPSPQRVRPQDFFARVESSRGCHYDTCTFCTRPPKDPKNPGWFRFPVDQVLKEIELIKAQGVTNFTFADEDFVGSDLESAKTIARGLRNIGGMRFSLSLRVDSVYHHDEPPVPAMRRLALFHLLREAGLSLVYLGIESLSNTQLERYGKGLRVSESVWAVNAILKLGVPVELGYILFDPLLTTSELRENLRWLANTSFWKYTGQLFNHLRLQRDTTYADLVGLRRLVGEYNPNTMDYDYSFRDPVIARIASICLKWKDEIDEVYTLARNIQRTSFSGGHSGVFVQKYRLLQFEILEALLSSLERSDLIELDPVHLSRRLHLVTRLRQGLISSGSLTPAGRTLLQAVERFLKREIEV